MYFETTFAISFMKLNSDFITNQEYELHSTKT